jgi:hypothetical protein
MECVFCDWECDVGYNLPTTTSICGFWQAMGTQKQGLEAHADHNSPIAAQVWSMCVQYM